MRIMTFQSLLRYTMPLYFTKTLLVPLTGVFINMHITTHSNNDTVVLTDLNIICIGIEILHENARFPDKELPKYSNTANIYSL